MLFEDKVSFRNDINFNAMKIISTLLFVLISTIVYGQVTFSKLPLNKQLVGRDVATNKGDIIVEGEVDNSGVNYDAIEVELYRDGVLQSTSTQTQALTFTGNLASFNFTIPITAELINYSIKIYGKQGVTLTLVEEVVDLVAGDVYIIQGQSIAEAKKINGSADSNVSNFIRVFSSGARDVPSLFNNEYWYIGQGDGSSSTDGNTGQWGLKFARMLVDNIKIPIAIFNGAEGGEIIDFFLAPPDYKESLNSNYARLYYRLNKTGLKNNVRAVIWSQGGSDGAINTPITEYKKDFLTLKNSWNTDCPKIEKFYIFQTTNSCNAKVHEIKEAQRQLAFENQDISIMSTAALELGDDDCHFAFVNGYEEFGKRIFYLINRDIYGVASTKKIDAPMIQSAVLINDNKTLEVVTDATTLSIATVAEDFRLEDANENDITDFITNITTLGNKIIFTLSSDPGENAVISYLAQAVGDRGNFITNSNGIEILCFYKYPIGESNLNVDDFEFKIINDENTLIIISTITINQVKVYDILGKLLIEKKPLDKESRIDIQNFKKGTVLMLNMTFDNGVSTSKKLIRY